MFGRIVPWLLVHIALVQCAAITANNTAAVSSSSYDCMYEWLRNIGLQSAVAEHYVGLFVREEIDERVLRMTTISQLQELGVSKHGHRILIHTSLLSVSLCDNHATCELTTHTSFQCSCAQGFSGVKCQYVTGCGETVCKNGATCSVQEGSVICECASGYSGQCCEHDVCEEEPCLNGGVCSHTSKGYHCDCALGYEGEHCQTAWLNKISFERLTKQVAFLERLQEVKDDSDQQLLLRVQSLLESTQGPRFFVQQSIIGPQGVVQVEHFAVDNAQYTLFLTNTPTQPQLSGVNIYQRYSNLSFHLIQTLSLLSPISVEVFRIGKDSVMVVLHDPSRATVYKWSPAQGQFKLTQEIRGLVGVQAAEHILADRVYNLLVLSCANGHKSSVYLWYDGQFELYQSLITDRGGRVHSLEAVNQLFVTMSGSIEAVVYRWNGTYLTVHQELPPCMDLVPVQTARLSFLVCVNELTTLYLLDNGLFTARFTATTSHAATAVHLHINTEHFIAFGGEQVDIYKMDGSGLIPFQSLPVGGTLSVFSDEHMTVWTDPQSNLPNTHMYTWTTD